MLIGIEKMFKTYNMGDTAVHALDGLSLTINAGDFVAVMGASGSERAHCSTFWAASTNPRPEGICWTASRSAA